MRRRSELCNDFTGLREVFREYGMLAREVQCISENDREGRAERAPPGESGDSGPPVKRLIFYIGVGLWPDTNSLSINRIRR